MAIKLIKVKESGLGKSIHIGNDEKSTRLKIELESRNDKTTIWSDAGHYVEEKKNPMLRYLA